MFETALKNDTKSKIILIFFVFIFSSDIFSSELLNSAVNQKNSEPNTASDVSNQLLSDSQAQLELQQKPPLVSLKEVCLEWLRKYSQGMNETIIGKACEKALSYPECRSVKNEPIFYYERQGYHKSPKKILVFSLIHGDEVDAGFVGKYWIERLESIEPRNHWRVVPVLNPDGSREKTRFNANKVDLNRNFPTSDWEALAEKYWKSTTNSNPRRFPGETAASEPEIKCALKHINEFKPDFIVSIHTPLNVLDYDGPRVKPPKFEYLPWRSLGNFPGSLGRYMWAERKTPVLTMELKDKLPNNTKAFEQLQDIIGTLVGSDKK